MNKILNDRMNVLATMVVILTLSMVAFALIFASHIEKTENYFKELEMKLNE